MSRTTASPIWTPTCVGHTSFTAFRHYVNRKCGLELRTYRDVHSWSVADIPQFSEAVFNFVGMTISTPYSKVVDGLEVMYPPPRWFPGANMNYAENMLRPGVGLKPDGIAVTTVDELPGNSRDYTFRELEEMTAVWAAALRKLGVRIGDRVAAVLPNRIDCLLVLLASASIGAIFTSTSPDMGSEGILQRYSQVRPTVLICDTAVQYGGKKIDLRDRFAVVEKSLRNTVPELKHTVVVNGPLFPGKNVVSAGDILNPTSRLPIKYEQLPFDHPAYILYSSGTTGTPKCITHAAGRALLMQKKELVLGSDVRPNSTLYQYTTTGWMMWNWSIAALSTGARIVLYDGSPLFPRPARQLELIRKEKVTHWGTSPKFLTALKQDGLPADMKLDCLQHVASAGAPLSVKLHQWFATSFPTNIGLFSGSGGTDLVGGIVSGNITESLYPGEIQGPNLGMKVEIWNHEGTNVEDTGDKGDLVITRPFFSMPIGFWGDDGEAKYRAAYFSRFPGVWHHGDFIRKNPTTGGYEILGRSDGVLNPGGIRFGSAEIYGVIEKFEDIQDCLCVGQKLPPDFSDEQVLLFLKMQSGKAVDKALKLRIGRAISASLSTRHVPTHVFQVQDIPYTVNGKRIENLVRDIVAGKPVGEATTAVNPECLVEYRRFVLPKQQGLESKL